MSTIKQIEKIYKDRLAELEKAQSAASNDEELGTVKENLKKLDENFKAMSYIKQLASLTNSDIKLWNITKLFSVNKDDDDDNLVSIQNEINKRFFEKLNNVTAKKIANKTEFELDSLPEVVEAIDFGVKSRLEGRKRDLSNSITRHLRDVSNYHKEIEYITANITKLRTEFDKLNGRDPGADIKKELADILSEGAWVNPVFEDGHLYLNTAVNVIIRHFNKRQGVDVELDVGQVAVKIDMNSFYMRVIPYKNNLRPNRESGYNDYFHPHVSGDGSICWGDAANNITKWQSEMKISKCLRLLHSLLYNYNDGNPFIPLAIFAANNKSYGRCPNGMMHPDKKRKPKSEDVDVTQAQPDENGTPEFVTDSSS